MPIMYTWAVLGLLALRSTPFSCPVGLASAGCISQASRQQACSWVQPMGGTAGNCRVILGLGRERCRRRGERWSVFPPLAPPPGAALWWGPCLLCGSSSW